MSWAIEKPGQPAEPITPENLFEFVNCEAPQPCAVLFFGADGAFRDSVLSRVWNGFHGYCFIISSEDFKDSITHNIAIQNARWGRNSQLYMDGPTSVDHAKRHALVTELRAAGTKTVVGIYVKSRYQETPLGYDYWAEREFSALSGDAIPCAGQWGPAKLHNDQVAIFESDPPTMDGLEALVTVTWEKEDNGEAVKFS